MTSTQSGYSESHSDMNLITLDEAFASLTPDQAAQALNHLIGAVSGYISPTVWITAVERAVSYTSR